jgi:sugar/nucleoside kinase (ribokinase family)
MSLSPAPRFDVMGIGNAIVDVIARCDDAMLARHDLIKGRMLLIDPDQVERLYANMSQSIETSGGSAANTIAGVASFGGTAAFIGKISDDEFGRIFRHDIRSLGITFDTPSVTGGAGTGRSLILVTPDGQRTMNTYLGAANDLGPAEVDASLIAASGITYLEGYLFDRPPAKEAFRLAAHHAHAAGRKVALSLSDSFCVDRHRAEFLALIRGNIDIVFANTAELLSLYETTSFDEAVARIAADSALAAVTRSEHGSLIVAGDQRIPVAAEPIAQLVDTTGAGDLYAAGFLFGLARGRAFDVCGKLGSLAAAEVITQIGPRPMKRLGDVARAHGISV